MKTTIILLIMALCFMIGCASTGTSNFPIQIKSNSEVLAPVSFAARIAAVAIKTKYPAEVELFIDLSDKVLSAEDNNIFDSAVQGLVDNMISKIKDPYAQEVVRAFVDSYEIDIDTGKIIFDGGARETALGAIRMMNQVLKEK